MTTINPFDLLGDNDNDDPLLLIESASAHLSKVSVAAAVDQKKSSQNQHQKSAKLPSKPLPPSQAVREARNETGRGGRGSGRGGGRGQGGYRDYPSNDNAFNNSRTAGGPIGDGEGGKDAERRGYGGPRPPYRGGRRGGFDNEEGRDGDRPRRTYERHSGTGRGNEFKREGSGRGNWGSQSDEVAPGTEEVAVETEKNLNIENLPAGEEVMDGNKEPQTEETEEKEMTLEEYEKVREEKRKALLAVKTEGRKVEVDKDLQSMQQLSSRRDDESVFIKLASDKDKKKDAADKEKAKKSVSINEFLKPADGEKHYNPGGRGRGRGGRGPRGGGSYGGGNRMTSASVPTIDDQTQFPTLGGAPRA